MKSTNLVTGILQELAEDLSGSLVCIKRLSQILGKFRFTREVLVVKMVERSNSGDKLT